MDELVVEDAGRESEVRVVFDHVLVATTMAEAPALGTIVTIPQGRGVVRFSGATSFSPGKWVGIELYEQQGKNDGSVGGVAYFTCKMGYGVFIRPSQIKATHGPEIDQTQRPPLRPPAGHHRTPSSDLLRTTVLRTPPSSSRSASPAKSQTGTPARGIPKPATSPSKRHSLTLQPRKSFPASPAPSSPTRIHSSPNSLSNKRPLSPPIVVPSPSAPVVSPSSKEPSPTPPPVTFQITPPGPRAPERPPSSLRHPIVVCTILFSNATRHQLPRMQPRSQDDQELQELRAKIRVLEAKRADDSRHIQELENRLSEAESFVALRPKLQAKLTSLSTELSATRREFADAQQLSQLSESRLLDVQEHLEMAMLDKEVAEEKAEIAETELEELKEKLAIAEVEMEVLKEGGGIYLLISASLIKSYFP